MAPRRRANCQICNNAESKYACPNCEVLYCSVPCYKQHSSYSCGASAPADAVQGITPTLSEDVDSESARARLAAHDDGSRAKEGKSSAGPEAVPDLLGGVSVSTSAPPLNSASQPSQGGGVEVSNVQRGAAPDMESDSKIDSNLNMQVEVGAAVGGEELILDESEGGRGRRPMRKLSSLRWPYVPDASSYPDPLTRDDPKPLSLVQYEAIARSPAIRHVLSSHPRLPALLRSLDALRGPAREESLQRTLGVLPSQATFALAGVPSSAALPSPTPASTSTSTSASYAHGGRGRGRRGEQEQGMVLTDEEDVRALRALAEAVERAVRGGDAVAVNSLGLDWEAMES